ncbi:ribosome hibernation-promoting factor, HPF/YfiA family [Oleidesulfovibrio sp.]|uniref:ribosome hibernation-promoting factor, HPF/YfiA family n=1 Tax=Oleidesulfovibrio sp. TaxID=2909707 RepID=UPI003A87D2EF
MNIAFTFKNFEPSEHLKKYANRRFEKLGRFLSKSENLELQVLLSVDKFRHKADVQCSGDGLNLSAVEQSEDMYATIDLVLDKLEAQVKKHAEKTKGKRRTSGDNSVRMDVFSYTDSGGVKERTIIETDEIDPKPMHIDEAAMQLDALDYEFLVFRNAENGRVNVIYRRKDSDFGLIDPGF